MSASHASNTPFWRSRHGVSTIVLGTLAAALLWTEHRAHLLGFLPYLFLLACPLMHVFMHHGSHGKGHSKESSSNEKHPHEPQ